MRRVLAAARYDEAIELAVKLLKFYDKPLLATPLGELLRTCAAQELDCAEYDFVIPVPLHRVRQRARGFNQAELLAREVLPAFSNARLDASLARIRPTRVLSRLHTDTDRKSSVRGAFRVARAPHLVGARVLLVDDVVTSGATVSECATALVKSGVATVDVLAVALALPRSHDTVRNTAFDDLA
ncbi:MAG: phosphoribosyltransferase family protein [Candidatus Hydrogenedentes bacterium]|nr:phosphoribosyltransferase family protein [Candidatus Hydrogenedentota bacterium]